MGDDTWGLLLKKDAIRDWELCEDVAELGIKTNHMECIIEIDKEITLENGHKLNLFCYNMMWNVLTAFAMLHL